MKQNKTNNARRRERKESDHEKKYSDFLIVLTSNWPFSGRGGRRSTRPTKRFRGPSSVQMFSAPGTSDASCCADPAACPLCPLPSASPSTDMW